MSDELTPIVAVTPTNVMDKEEMKLLLNSTKSNNITLDFIGVGKEFSFISKIHWFAEYLETIDNDETIVCFTDAYDAFYITGLDTIRDKFISINKDIIFSSERGYSHQLDKDKPFFDKLGKDKDYRYLNTGGFIGYAGTLRRFFNDLLKLLDTTWFDVYIANEDSNFNGNRVKKGEGFVDQMIISHYITRSLDNYSIGLDYNADIFYTPVGDWDEWVDDADDWKESNPNFSFTEDGLQLHRTESSPCIVHVPCKYVMEDGLKRPARLPMLQHLYKGIYD